MERLLALIARRLPGRPNPVPADGQAPSSAKRCLGPEVLLLVLAAAWIGCFQLVNEDIGTHVRTGDRMIAEGTLRFTDDFSYTVAGEKEYMPVHWAYYLAVSFLHRVGNESALGIAKMIAVGLFAFFLATGLRGAGTGRIAAIAIALGVTLIVRERWLVRPQLISYVLFTWVLTRLPRSEGLTVRHFVLFPLAFLAAVNFHPGAVFAWGLVACYAFMGLIQGRGGRSLGLLLLCTLACLLTPVTPYHVIYLWKHVHIFERIRLIENAPATLQQYPVFFAVLGLWIVGTIADRFRAPKWQLLATAGLFAAGWWAIRLIPYPMIGAAVTLAPAARRLFESRGGAGLRWIAPASAVLLLAVVAAWPLWHRHLHGFRPGFGWNTRAMPVGAARFLDDIEFRGSIQNYNPFGGYLIFHGYPRWHVVSDGRMQIYEEVLQLSLTERMRRFPGEALIFPSDPGDYGNTIATAGVRDAWELVFMDGAAYVLLRKDGPYRHIVETHGLPHIALPVRRKGRVMVGWRVLPGESEAEADRRFQDEAQRIFTAAALTEPISAQ